MTAVLRRLAGRACVRFGTSEGTAQIERTGLVVPSAILTGEKNGSKDVIHIDWLTISQQHQDAPEWGSVRRLDMNMKSGEIEVQRILSETVQASWDTSLQVRSTGGRVEVSGNPSKWGRLDAVTGLGDLWGGIAVYNQVLDKLGLPRFERRGFVLAEDGTRIQAGPQISRVDLTRNLVAGRAGVRPLLDWMASQVWGSRLAFRQTGEYTVSAGRRNRRQRVFYDKGAELEENRARWKRSRAFEKETAVAYLVRLADWAKEIGLVRDEIRLGTKWLSGHALRAAENWKSDTAERLFEEQSEIQTLEAGAMSDYREGAYKKLVTNGWSERMAGTLQKVVISWMNGGEWKLGLSQATAYRYAGILRRECGLDVRKPMNVRSIALRIKPKVLEARPLRKEELPPWYDEPERFKEAA